MSFVLLPRQVQIFVRIWDQGCGGPDCRPVPLRLKPPHPQILQSNFEPYTRAPESTALQVLIRTDVMYRRVPPVFDDDVGVRAYALHAQAAAAEGEGDCGEAVRLYRHCRRLCPAYADFVGLG